MTDNPENLVPYHLVSYGSGKFVVDIEEHQQESLVVLASLARAPTQKELVSCFKQSFSDVNHKQANAIRHSLSRCGLEQLCNQPPQILQRGLQMYIEDFPHFEANSIQYVFCKVFSGTPAGDDYDYDSNSPMFYTYLPLNGDRIAEEVSTDLSEVIDPRTTENHICFVLDSMVQNIKSVSSLPIAPSQDHAFNRAEMIAYRLCTDIIYDPRVHTQILQDSRPKFLIISPGMGKSRDN